MYHKSEMHAPKFVSHWHVYSYLKQVNGKTSLRELLNKFSDADKIMEGIKEYNEMAIEHPYYKTFKSDCYEDKSVYSN